MDDMQAVGHTDEALREYHRALVISSSSMQKLSATLRSGLLLTQKVLEADSNADSEATMQLALSHLNASLLIDPHQPVALQAKARLYREVRPMLQTVNDGQCTNVCKV